MKLVTLLIVMFCVSGLGGFSDSLSVWELGKVRSGAIQSAERRKFEGVIEQGLDRSCGLASLVTLVALYWDYKLTEAEILNEERANLNGQGFVSLKFLSGYLTKIGFTNETYELDYQNLLEAAKNYAPVIVHYKWPDLHFALALAVFEEGVIVADSARGVEFVERPLFESRWSGLALFASSTRNKPNSHYLEKVVGEKLRQKILLLSFSRRKL